MKPPLPEYANPPVGEVSVGIQFASLEKLLAPHLGLLWERYYEKYPTCQEAPPLLPVIEKFDGEIGPPKYELQDKPPLPRVWFLHSNGTELIQVQRDRFLFNWRRNRSSDKYPRYPHVKQHFFEHINVFRDFIRDFELGPLQPNQYELTYVNYILQGEGWTTPGDLSRIFPDIAWRQEERFLSEPERLLWQASFILPEEWGRLHAVIRTAVTRADRRPLYQFELTARGIGRDPFSEGSLTEWLDIGREWIVRGFTDLTAETVQRDTWRRIQ